jgi:subtilisin-like proprotein convertase family protein
VRLLGEGRNTASTDIKEAAALGWRTDVVQISNNSWGPDDDAITASGPETATIAALRAGVESGRSNRGVLYFVATGNGRDEGDHAGYDSFSGSRYVFAVAATNSRGRQASFSESGPQAIVCAAGQTLEGSETQLLAADNVGPRGVNTSASPEGDYTTSGTQGTSYSTPQAAGVAALMLQANPNLGWRDVKEIFIRTARKNDPTDTEWVVNGAGFHFNHKYGAGFIDASAAVALARTWTNLGPEQSTSLASNTAGTVTDNAPAGLSRTFAFTSASSFRAETVEVTVNVSHAKRGQLRFELISPAGTTTVLGAPRAKDTTADFSPWTFSTPRHWGESAAGTWTVRVIDTVEGVTGTLNSASVSIYGSLTSAASAPVITTAPAAVTTTVGGSATFSVTASSSAPMTYQWRKDGVAISGATGATLTLNSVAAADAGTYSVVVSNAVGSTTSSGAALSVAVGITSRLSNLSVRTPLGAGRTFIVGFVMTGGAKPVLLRAVGPRLGVFGVTDAHPNPRFELFNSANASVAQNDDWGGGPTLAATFASVGAFSLEADSRDAALSSSLSGGHTVHISGTGSGVVLVEAYDAGSGNSPRLLNVSARNRVGAGGDILIAGFVIGGTGSKTVLIRAVGPTLSAFGVANPLKDPKLEVYQGSTLVAENDDWAPSLSAAFSKVGAFPLPAQSLDAALTLTLQPNAYTVHVKGLDGGSGEAIIEIYDLDG